MKVLILGITGMLGSAVFHSLNQAKNLEVWGTLRKKSALNHFPEEYHARIVNDVEVLDIDNLLKVCETIRPNVIINCIGLIKQLAVAKDPLVVLPINAMLPHRLANIASLIQARLIHISTDCVFSGKKGNYRESDLSDAEDLYGKSKYIGEVSKGSALTIRTSIIGHELNSNYALVDWFLSQKENIKGFSKAIFSGFPTMELARIIRDYVLPQEDLSGLYHVASNAIDKYSLLSLIAEVYNKKINIIEDTALEINRSLNAERFNSATGYIPPQWPELISSMHASRHLFGVK
ncbi:dTDP-4-dehydrorhamnose reductase (plasmid) [Legionella adelaidensis]|uniref:dTDP-4-dehydrorhamnose reductase n=1 Tax=Legionella adelaidensis TaxID=45056 RepID=A0A0W0R4S5_9GAMM|nr:SDR family oxidoreductase [Legionella adelaidensis]KTC66034.1 dTDP-4-dehydrorhamnose reductase [Legionella adelaidensis]VEH85693.1 dTDP-4-dehydrorhamnose reductase [Legionella adelaidensis]